MAAALAERNCVVCKPGTPPLQEAAINQLLTQLEGWAVEESLDKHLILTKTYRYKGFMPGVRLVDRIAEIAEAEGHHPDLHLHYGRLVIELWTHAASGLTENDFVLAAKIDRLGPQ